MQISKQDIATLIHDGRAPARHIRQFALLAQEEAEQYNNKELNKSLETIIERVLVLEAMIDGFAEISDIATADVENASIDLKQLLESQTQAFGLKLKAAVLPRVDFDANLISTAIREVVKNAAVYAEDGILQAMFGDDASEHQTLTLSNQVAVAYEKYPGNLTMPFTKPDRRPTKESIGKGLAIANAAMTRGGGALSARYANKRFIVELSFVGST